MLYEVIATLCSAPPPLPSTNDKFHDFSECFLVLFLSSYISFLFCFSNFRMSFPPSLQKQATCLNKCKEMQNFFIFITLDNACIISEPTHVGC